MQDAMLHHQGTESIFGGLVPTWHPPSEEWDCVMYTRKPQNCMKILPELVWVPGIVMDFKCKSPEDWAKMYHQIQHNINTGGDLG